MNFKRLLKQDFIITFVILVLLGIGTLVIFSTTYNTQSSDLLTKQIILITIGLIIYFALILIDINWFKVFSIQLILYIFIISTLLYAVLFGSTIAGTNRWIDLGFFAFQPSEYSKVLIIMFISLIFSSENLPLKENLREIRNSFHKEHGIKHNIKEMILKIVNDREFRGFFYVLIYVIPIVVLTFIQPSLGNTIIIIGLTLFTLFFSTKFQTVLLKIILLGFLTFFFIKNFIRFDTGTAGFSFSADVDNYFVLISSIIIFVLFTFFIKVKWWFVLSVALTTTLFLFSSIFAWNQLLGNYQRERVLTFIEGPEADPLGSGYQIIQSKIAIGSGQLFGRGFLQGTQSSLHILTQAHTDFAFASMSEQFGFVGALLLLSTYLILLLRILKIAKETKSDFGRNLAFGVVGLLLIHIFINIGMNLGKLPVTGIPLPLVSYGGSSVLMTLIVLGLIQSVHASRRPVDMADSLMLTSLAGNKSE
jgi:rod shape determining protein RodA